MLDVHVPEHGIHGTRDFFLHLFTITIGLLIALGLEASVEAIHHRHQRHEAETLIRNEIQNNLQRLTDEAPQATRELHQMTAVLETLQARADGQTGVLHEKDFVFHEAPIQDAAWRTANSTGALTLMDYAEVERFSDAYKEQALLQTMEEQALEDYLELLPVLSYHSKDGVVSPEAAKEAIPYTRRVVAHLNGMLAVGAGTVGTYPGSAQIIAREFPRILALIGWHLMQRYGPTENNGTLPNRASRPRSMRRVVLFAGRPSCYFPSRPAHAAEKSFAFTVQITLSPKAAATLAKLSEGIVASATYAGEPVPAAIQYADQIGQIDLGMETVESSGKAGTVQITGEPR